MEKLVKLFPVIISLVMGGYLGYFFTNDHYMQKEASDNKIKNTAICRFELRDGKKGDIKEKYVALFEYRTGDGGEAFCEKYMPSDNLPDDTYRASLNSLYPDADYNQQILNGG